MSQNHAGSSTRQPRQLTPEQRRRVMEMRRKKRRKKQLQIIVATAFVLLAAIGVTLGLTLGRKGDDRQQTSLSLPDAVETQEALSAPNESPSMEDSQLSEGSGEATAPASTPDGTQPTENAPLTSEGSAYIPEGGTFVYDDAYVAAARGADTGALLTADLSKVDASKLNRWPTVEEGYMPVTYSAKNVTEKIIAITVDDCFQASNLREIVQCALDNNAKLTIFPIGDNLAKESIGSAVKWAWESGMEIENHTYNHVGLYHYGDKRMAKEIWAQSMILNQVLGVNYQEHFFRPKGGDEHGDQRVHAYVRQLGIQAVAIWGASGSSNNIHTIINNLRPGQVYLFHTTDKDLEKLLYFIPYAVQQGYRLVTMNELFGLPENETSDISTQNSEMPVLQPFKVLPARLRKDTYVRAAAVVQKRLIELGWLNGEADGVFGASSATAISNFQRAVGIKADGIAGGKTQIALFADDAPHKK